ncbi:MAG: hypothetical protein [Caudoviricetes sp.]|nr:MAG: hypothetical protein [Caudoviricetes sp.]
MSKTLADVTLLDFVPESLKHDSKIIALCASLQPELNELQSLLPYAQIYGNIDNLPESILQYMAWENGVYGAEWTIAGTIDKRRELVKNSFLLNKLRGTRWAVERIFELLGWRVELKEWFEEGADPYTFRVSLLDITGIGMTEEESKWINALMTAYKPVSRHLTSINLVSSIEKATTHAKIGVYFRAKTEVS